MWLAITEENLNGLEQKLFSAGQSGFQEAENNEKNKNKYLGYFLWSAHSFFSIGVCKTTKYEVMMKGEIKNEKMVLCYKEKKLEEIKRLKESWVYQ